MLKTTKALVLREAKYKESQKILTMLSETYGKITATAYGAYGKKSVLASSTQHLTYSEFVLEEKNGRVSIKEGITVEPFSELREDYSDYSLACYFADCMDFFCMEATPDLDLLRLILNSLYALSKRMYSSGHIKAAFELKLMSLTGFKPDISSCRECGCVIPDDPVFCYESGCLCCRACRKSSMGNGIGISQDALAAMRHVLSHNLKNFLSFQIDEASEENMCNAAEAYFRFHSGKTFATLDYWKKIQL